VNLGKVGHLTVFAPLLIMCVKLIRNVHPPNGSRYSPLFLCKIEWDSMQCSTLVVAKFIWLALCCP